jgi:glycosyltransferase involved in cell wall biosynthesis
VGSGPEQKNVEAQIERLGLRERVRMTAWVPSTEMPDRMRGFDILVIPSRTRHSWKEQYGRVIIEAMASGVAVIGSDSGAIPDVIGEAGLVFPEDDVEALVDHLRCLITDRSHRQTLAMKGRKRILEHFTQDQIANQTIAVYQNVL